MNAKRGIKVLTLLGLAACQTPTREITPTVHYIEHSKHPKGAAIQSCDYSLLTTEIENYFISFAEDGVLHAPEHVRKKYQERKYFPCWIYTPDALQNAKFLDVLAKADSHGLDRNIYHYSQLETNFENLNFFYFQTGKINYQLWAESEILLTDGLMLLAKHLKHGAFDPLANNNHHYYILPQDSNFNVLEIFYTEDLSGFLENQSPQNFQYAALQNEYLKRLKKPEKSRTTKDIDTLNVLRVNMERWRWNSLFSDSVLTVYVNIPAFEMRVLKKDSVLMESKICVGKKRLKNYAELRKLYLKNPYIAQHPPLHETPVLKNEISYIVLNPQWRVPSTIAKNEVLRNVQRDSSFLERMEYTVYSGNTLIDPYTVKWKEISPLQFPYRFEQSAGEKNALGKMKFMFPNVFNVYLHDTPTKRDFSRRNRAVSHGCVRVEDFRKLSEILLLNMPKYDSAYIAKALNLHKNVNKEIKPENIFLKTRVPIILDYKTAWINEFGELQTYNDVYDRDRWVLETLQNPSFKRFQTKE